MTAPVTMSAKQNKSAAKDAGLRYVSDAAPGIRRIQKGKSFTYKDANGKTVRDAATLKRIHSLVIPPAWQDVWICSVANGHMQVTARDGKNRKQYRYHPQWRLVRDATKFDTLISFGKVLPVIRKQVQKDLKKTGLPKEKVLAAIVRILDITHVRIGNEEYAKENRSYGLTTLQNRHVNIDGDTVRFRFRGKSGQHQDVHFKDARLARIIKQCEELPGHELFAYRDDEGNDFDITSQDVNAYLHAITGEAYTAKEFRTWGGTVQAALCLYHLGECDSDAKAKHCMTCAVKDVATFLGNTPATCKKYYIDPRIFNAYTKKSLCDALSKNFSKKHAHDELSLMPIEKAVLHVLKQAKG